MLFFEKSIDSLINLKMITYEKNTFNGFCNCNFNEL
jgi:hypothetical protein